MYGTLQFMLLGPAIFQVHLLVADPNSVFSTSGGILASGAFLISGVATWNVASDLVKACGDHTKAKGGSIPKNEASALGLINKVLMQSLFATAASAGLGVVFSLGFFNTTPLVFACDQDTAQVEVTAPADQVIYGAGSSCSFAFDLLGAPHVGLFDQYHTRDSETRIKVVHGVDEDSYDPALQILRKLASVQDGAYVGLQYGFSHELEAVAINHLAPLLETSWNRQVLVVPTKGSVIYR